MAEIKVKDIAKEYELSSDAIIEKLGELGEAVKSAQSTIIKPVEKKLRGLLGEPPEKKIEKVEEKAPKAVPTAASTNQQSQTPTPNQSAVSNQQNDQNDQQSLGGSTQASPVAFSADPNAPVPRPTVVPSPSAMPSATQSATTVEMPKPKRLNNPFMDASGSASGIPKPGIMHKPVVLKPGQAGSGSGRKFGNRSNGQGGQSAGQNAGQNTGQNTGQRGGQNTGFRSQNGNVGANPGNRFGQQKAPGRQNSATDSRGTTKGPGNNSPGGPPPLRPGGKRGKGSTGGAHGNINNKKRNYKEKKRRDNENDEFFRPTVAGVVVPHGDGSTEIRLKQGATLVDFAEKIGASAANLVTTLFKLGEIVNQNQSIDEDTFKLLGVELGYKIQIVSEEEEDRELLNEFDIDLDAEEGDISNLETRPPVVTVMGHVDHGKTRLLDAIRNTNVIETEAGGITQRIGAYQIKIDHEGKERPITFIDTPGHEAFTAMRARGAEITDVAVLVVAADDGVMPQTVEAISHAKAAGVPIVVAVNKIDKEGADPVKIRGQLTEFELVPEEYGGDTIFVDISARNNQNIDVLLDSILLTVDAAMELKANPDMQARGAVIEARLDKGRGAVTALLVQTGTLRVGDPIVAGRSYGKVRAMTDENGKPVKEATPARPVRVLGMQTVPSAGDSFLVADDERTARQIAEKREAAHRAAMLAKRRKRVTLEDFKQAVEDGKVDVLNLIIKGATSGSVEALEDALLQLEENAELNGEVGLNVIHRAVGDITENDVNLATVDNAIIIGFDVKPAGHAGDLAESEGVDIRHYKVIYDAIDDIELSLHGMLKPEYEEDITGYAEVREIFKSSKFGTIAGSMVKGGEITRNSNARVMRGESVFADGLKVESLKRFKDDVTEVKDGFECGIGLGSFNDIEVGDIIETYKMVEIKRELPKSLKNKSTEKNSKNK